MALLRSHHVAQTKMVADRTYSKRISSEEEQESYILILKDRLPFFPPQGHPFELSKGRNSQSVKVESYPCQCRGPELPHEHYFVRWSGLKQGQTIVISKDSARNNQYSLTLN